MGNEATFAWHSRGDGLSSPCSSCYPTTLTNTGNPTGDGLSSPCSSCYPPPHPLPHTRIFWLATALVTLLVLLFSTYFILYLTGRQDAFLTNAEDMGIMDQAIWNTLHGHLLHQSICNIVGDTNCSSFNGISRFAIHFEPILFPVSLLYLAWPSPKTLLILQTLVVASGAFPAFWLARLRLRSELAGVVIALLYLLYPGQQNALVFDFHAVTFTASLLLFALYFMYTRRTAWLFVFAILAMACKEEIPVVIAFFALWSILLQRRWHSSLALLLLAAAWTVLGLLIIHFNSPGGQSLLASRYAYLGDNPLQIARTFMLHPLAILKQHVLDAAHRAYLASLLAPAGYLPLLAPWILVLALPTLALNMLSSDPAMYSGIFQYNAEITPILVFATIEAIASVLWIAERNFIRRSGSGSFTGRFFGNTWEGMVSCRGGSGWEEWWGRLRRPLVLSSVYRGYRHVPDGLVRRLRRPLVLSSVWVPGRRKRPLPAPPRSRPYGMMPLLRRFHKNLPVKAGVEGMRRGDARVALVDQHQRATRASPLRSAPTPTMRMSGSLKKLPRTVLLTALLSYALFSVIHENYTLSAMPFAQGFRWPRVTAHAELAQRFIEMIPLTASVSAQTRLVPHLSQRVNIYLFPYADDRADYIFLDVTGDRYPYFDTQAYNREVQKILQSRNYVILAAEDGYLLLKHALPPPTRIKQLYVCGQRQS